MGRGEESGRVGERGKERGREWERDTGEEREGEREIKTDSESSCSVEGARARQREARARRQREAHHIVFAFFSVSRSCKELLFVYEEKQELVDNEKQELVFSLSRSCKEKTRSCFSLSTSSCFSS